MADREQTGESGRARRRMRGRVLASYGDHRARAHRVVLRGRFVLDLVQGELPRVVCELGEGEGEPEARATLKAGRYLERARTATGPLCRTLTPDDLRPAQGQDKIAVERRAA
jgi:hypothetical protein